MLRKFDKVNKSFNSFKPLLSKVLKEARENSKAKTYSSYFEKSEVNVLPVDEFHIVLFMMHLRQTGKPFPVIGMSYVFINYFHSIVGYRNLCPTSLPYNVLEDIKRILAYSATKK